MVICHKVQQQKITVLFVTPADYGIPGGPADRSECTVCRVFTVDLLSTHRCLAKGTSSLIMTGCPSLPMMKVEMF